jgi:hypothetical protein
VRSPVGGGGAAGWVGWAGAGAGGMGSGAAAAVEEECPRHRMGMPAPILKNSLGSCPI